MKKTFIIALVLIVVLVVAGLYLAEQNMTGTDVLVNGIGSAIDFGLNQ